MTSRKTYRIHKFTFRTSCICPKRNLIFNPEEKKMWNCVRIPPRALPKSLDCGFLGPLAEFFNILKTVIANSKNGSNTSRVPKKLCSIAIADFGIE
jgi:hypothetical protein